jgi:hypothetical protein
MQVTNANTHKPRPSAGVRYDILRTAGHLVAMEASRKKAIISFRAYRCRQVQPKQRFGYRRQKQRTKINKTNISLVVCVDGAGLRPVLRPGHRKSCSRWVLGYEKPTCTSTVLLCAADAGTLLGRIRRGPSVLAPCTAMISVPIYASRKHLSRCPTCRGAETRTVSATYIPAPFEMLRKPKFHVKNFLSQPNNARPE